ncbi:MAG: pyridoxal phosphate-dependent aminotransferase [Patescibacteria group bacterium]|nr:pyridoxal phosphate-dependent aminotransferase [Patescibacteria group bacterium]
MFSRTKNINLSPIKQIELLASKIPDVVSLAQGIPSFDTPEVVKKAAIKALNRGAVAKYSLTYGLPELRETIEQKLAEEGMFYDFENEIIVTAGSIEAITAALTAIIEPNKNEIILFSPSYTSYAEAVKVSGGKPVFSDLMENEGWRIDFNDLKKKTNAKTAGILFCNPNNPTGTIFPKEDLLKIAELAEKKKFFILSDEVYKDFIYNNNSNSEAPFFSLAQIPELRKKVIRIFSLSKAYAMTGWRIGFLHSDEENVKEILKIHDSLVTCAPVISQYAAIGALDYGDREIEKFRREFQTRRDLMCEYLDGMKNYFSYQNPKGAYFIFPKILPAAYKILQTKNSWEFALKLLEKAKVAVVPGAAFGPSGEHHFRISFGRDEKDIRESMERFKKIFNV